MIRIGSLFSGIGGLELGIEAALRAHGIWHRVAWQVESSAFCRRVLAKHWPEANRSVQDVREASAENLEPVDLICGGFPCQDVSVAGKGEGITGARSGLWSEFARIVDECQPSIVIVENVAHGRSRYLCEVRSDLQKLGYGTTAFVSSAQSVGANHRRERCFIVAHADGIEIRERAERKPRRPSGGVRNEGSAEPGHLGGSRGRDAESEVRGSVDGVPGRVVRDPRWTGLPIRWATGRERRDKREPSMAIRGPVSPWHAEELEALGNAVAPASAAEVMADAIVMLGLGA